MGRVMLALPVVDFDFFFLCFILFCGCIENTNSGRDTHVATGDASCVTHVVTSATPPRVRKLCSSCGDHADQYRGEEARDVSKTSSRI